MASYVVMEPPAREDDAVLVRDGFHLLAFLAPFLWFLFHRLWIEALVVLALALALGVAGSLTGISAAPALSLLVSVYVGLEGAALRVAALRRRGWREWGVVEADNPADAEVRYLAEEYADAPSEPPAPRPLGIPRQQPAGSGPALGLFSYPGRG